MKWCYETATGAGRTVPDDYVPKQHERVKDMVVEDPRRRSFNA